MQANLFAKTKEKDLRVWNWWEVSAPNWSLETEKSNEEGFSERIQHYKVGARERQKQEIRNPALLKLKESVQQQPNAEPKSSESEPSISSPAASSSPEQTKKTRTFAAKTMANSSGLKSNRPVSMNPSLSPTRSLRSSAVIFSSLVHVQFNLCFIGKRDLRNTENKIGKTEKFHTPEFFWFYRHHYEE